MFFPAWFQQELLIFHVMRYNKPVPIFHIAMTNKKETLYTEIMEWIKQECPLLNPQDINMDFELAEMNSAKAVFDIDPTGCDFHYNHIQSQISNSEFLHLHCDILVLSLWKLIMWPEGCRPH